MVRKEAMEEEPTPIPSDAKETKKENQPKSITEHSDIELKAMGYDLVAEIDDLMGRREQLISTLKAINEELSERMKKD